MSDSDSSALSSLASDDERIAPIFLKAKGKKQQKKVKKVNVAPTSPPSPPRPKRSPSPEHEEVLADNADVAFIVMFRSRFGTVFPTKLANYGPQDIERGVVDSTPSPQVENLLCAILALALNRKKPIERGHHGRALEEAISHNKHQWPKTWNGANPLPGNKVFNDLGPAERLNLLRTLIIWSLTTSDEISRMIKDSYKQTRHEDDLNQPLSVQPWGQDDDKRKYWLIEGQDDTSFRLYREGNRALKNILWRSVAGTIDEVKAVAETLETKHHSQASRRLASRIHAAVPRFEATEEKRRRREYRQIRRQQFARPEPGFSLYEGRTRGKRARYTFDDNDDEDDFESDALSVRRSTRQRSDRSTPVDAGPTVTASGRTVRPRGGGMYGETLLSGQTTGLETGSYAASENSESLNEQGRATRASRRSGGAANLNGNRKRKLDTYNSYDEMSDESDADQSGDQWDGGDDDDDKDNIEESDDDDMSVDEEEDTLGGRRNSLIVKLKVGNRVKDDTSALDDLSTIKSSQDIPELERKPPMTTEEPIGNLHNPASVGSKKPEEEAAPNPKSEPMDIDPPQAKLLKHPSSLDLPINDRSEHPAPASSATNAWPLPKEQNLPQQTEVPAQVHIQVQQVHANGWS